MSGDRPDTLLADAMTRRPVVLDGGLATELERRGHDVTSSLWSARLLMDDPAAIVDAHRAFFAAGAQVATTASSQATVEGFARAGVDRTQATRLMTRSVTLALEAGRHSSGGSDWWVAGSVGPYGAMLADGSEYTGSYTAPGWRGGRLGASASPSYGTSIALAWRFLRRPASTCWPARPYPQR